MSEKKPEMEIKKRMVYARADEMGPVVEKKKTQGIEDFDEWEFGDVTVADCIAEKIPPKEILSTGSFWVNMSWLHIIALINRKSKSDKRINTQIKVKDFLILYEKLMNKTFL